MLVVCDAIFTYFYIEYKKQLEQTNIGSAVFRYVYRCLATEFLLLFSGPGDFRQKNWREAFGSCGDSANFPDFAVATFWVPHVVTGSTTGATLVVIFWYDATMQHMMLALSNLSTGTFGEWIDSFCLVKRLSCEKSLFPSFSQIGSAIAVVKPAAA